MNVLGSRTYDSSVIVPCGNARLPGDIVVPADVSGVVIFAHGSGSSRLSPRNRLVARALQSRGLATLLFDLLTEEEECEDYYSTRLCFNISLLARRLIAATDWVCRHETIGGLPAGYFGSSTGAAAALVTAATDGRVRAIVLRGGRPDLAAAYLERVQAPVLLIVGGNDRAVIDLNERARQKLRCRNSISIVAGANHLFEEPGALEEVARQAGEFFIKYLNSPSRSSES